MKLDRVVVFDMNQRCPVTDSHKQYLKSIAPDTEFLYPKTFEELYTKYDDADALVSMPNLPPEMFRFIKNAPSLKWFHCLISGVDALISSDLWNMPIKVTSTKGIHAPMISDLALTYIFSFLRQFPSCIRGQIEHKWVGRELGVLIEESFDKTVGVIGVGSIGMEIARKCKLLGMRVVGAKRTPVESEWLDKCYTMDQIDELLKESDFVILMIPLSKETENLIGARELGLMKKSAYLINLARGGVLDHQALMKALDNGQIAGAGLDIFVKEPLEPGDPLWDYKQIIISHHTAPGTPHYTDRAIRQVIGENIKRYLADEPLMYQWK